MSVMCDWILYNNFIDLFLFLILSWLLHLIRKIWTCGEILKLFKRIKGLKIQVFKYFWKNSQFFIIQCDVCVLFSNFCDFAGKSMTILWHFMCGIWMRAKWLNYCKNKVKTFGKYSISISPYFKTKYDTYLPVIWTKSNQIFKPHKI